jgi:hypothetical protein
MKMQITVVPAWIAGTQARKDASGNVHVNLDSSSPCWNDVKLLFGLLPGLARKPSNYDNGHFGFPVRGEISVTSYSYLATK